jgi:hypothetical protein
MRHVVLALDLATTTGWALHKQGMERPFFGAFRLPGGKNDVGAAAEGLRVFLADKHSLYGLTDVAFEDQFIPGDINSATARRLMGLAAMVEWFCFVMKIRCYSVHLSQWRKHFIGRGGAFKVKDKAGNVIKTIDPKELAIQKCAEFGWHTDVADAAEACGVLDYFITMIPGYDIPWRDKLLLGGVR